MSFVLNDDPNQTISAATRDRVRRAAACRRSPSWWCRGRHGGAGGVPARTPGGDGGGRVRRRHRPAHHDGPFGTSAARSPTTSPSSASTTPSTAPSSPPPGWPSAWTRWRGPRRRGRSSCVSRRQ
nr:hypothetical protein [Streptomyces fulvoviolaceus]